MEDTKANNNDENAEKVEENLNSLWMNTTYATVTMKLPKYRDFIKYLHNKYTILIDILLQADEELLVNPYDPITTLLILNRYVPPNIILPI